MERECIAVNKSESGFYYERFEEMKTLILYATKYGATKEIAGRIAARIPGSTVCDLKSSSIPSVSQFDCIILGSSLYVGKIRKEAKVFITRNTEALSEKKIGLFLSGLEPEHTKEFFANNFPEILFQNAKATAFLGGIYNPQKGSAFDKFLLKAAKKPAGSMNTVSDEEITRFAEEMTV